ncbi:PF07603 family protein [Leptospira santarosai]|uniref:PF07603 family protein n=1 Tax=Leptospira santarosai TaxID=28183 RepID=A0A2P1QNK9_9LEPT|nr:PF07603 family protein [Leptospira santarosai]
MYRYLASFFIFSFLFCAKLPNKPDPPYVIFQYLQKLNSNTQQEEQTNNSANDPCANGPANFNPGAVFDTGQTLCWNNLGPAACPGTGTDGEFNNTPNARTFSAPTQHCKFSSDYTTFDSLHGLTWKTCAQGQTGSNCSGAAATAINWTNANAGLAGSCTALNGLNGGQGYAGKTDWRIPTVKELASLIHYSNTPRLDNISFPNTFSGTKYMTDTPDVTTPGSNWAINFSGTLLAALGISNEPQGNAINLRCVSGNQIPAFSFVDLGDGTVRDQNTGLLWSQCSEGQAGLGCPGASLILDWFAALNACNNLNLAGRTNWRLPNVNELLSIVNFNNSNPAINALFFPNTPNLTYWTSTTDEVNIGFAISISAGSGSILSGLNDKFQTLNVRCVTTF